MPFIPTQGRERILLFGPWGGGKSFAWGDVAKYLAITNTDAKIQALDTDFAWERMRYGYDNKVQTQIVTAWDCYDYDSLKSALDVQGRPQDWLVVDMIDKMWDWSQSGFSEKAFGKTVDEWFMSALTAGENPGGDYGVNWGVINRMYGTLFTKILRWPGHVIACAPSDDVQQPSRDGKGGDDAETRALYSGVNKKPKGQKNLGHQFHTVIYAQDSGQGGWRMTTVKDRVRERMQGKVISKGFVGDYLVPIAKWKVVGSAGNQS